MLSVGEACASQWHFGRILLIGVRSLLRYLRYYPKKLRFSQWVVCVKSILGIHNSRNVLYKDIAQEFVESRRKLYNTRMMRRVMSLLTFISHGLSLKQDTQKCITYPNTCAEWTTRRTRNVSSVNSLYRYCQHLVLL